MARAISLVDLLREAQCRFPDRQAILHRGRATAYAVLWRSIVRTANVLMGLGVRQGDRVALLIENSPDYVIAYYAVLKVGAVVVGLNTAQRGSELSRNVTHCAASLLIARANHLELDRLVGACSCLRQVLIMGFGGELCAGPAGANAWTQLDVLVSEVDIDVKLDEDNDNDVDLDAYAPATIIYTSGTTGDPRGVTLSHRNLVANVRSILQYLRLTENDRILNVLPFYYSYGNSVLHTHLAVGASLVLENSLTYPHLVVESMAKERTTGFSGVPSTFALLLRRVNLCDFDLSSLRYVTQAGGAMAPSLVQRLIDALPHARLFIMYGQTEATARISYVPPERLREKLGSAGIAIPGVELDVRDEHDRSVPAGAVGEVCVRGENVMLGYWNNPVATDAVLHDGWLHTGDLGCLDPDGYLMLVGRASDMIKTGAHRVSPLEIEEVMLELDGVMECAAVGIPDDIMGEVIKAFVVREAVSRIDARSVQAHCFSRLAAYKVPREVEFVTTLPRTASGKIKRFMLKTAG